MNNGQLHPTEIKFILGKYDRLAFYIEFCQDLNQKELLQSAEKTFN